MRAAFLAISILALGAFLALTVAVIINNGFTIFSLLAIAVLAVMGVGIIGALIQRPPK